MSRIKGVFDRLLTQKRTALIPYITAGDPQPEITVPLMHAMVSAGADVLELGVPFSDPMADGPVIQAACERALKHHVSLKKVLSMVAAFRKQDADTPVVLMGYLNPFEVMGYEIFAQEAQKSGVDGVITVDLPPEEAESMVTCLKGCQVDPVFLLSPTTTPERIRKIAAVSSGFLYYVSLKGVTGAANLNLDEVSKRLQNIREYTTLPVGVGFGVKDAATARAVGRFADAVVVGSALVRQIEKYAGNPGDLIERVSGLLADIRHALDENIQDSKIA